MTQEANMCAGKFINVNREMFEGMDLDKAFELINEKKKLKILVCGKTGTGKSTLLNTLLGQTVFETGGPATKTVGPVTTEVKSVRTDIQDVLLEIFDSPGLQDCTDNDRKYLDDMRKKCKDFCLILYCIDMATARWDDKDSKTIELLTKTFGQEMWKKAILVLTKANTVMPTEPGVDEHTHCKTTLETFEGQFQKQLTQLNVSKEVSVNIPIVATGSLKQRYIPFVSKSFEKEDTKKNQDFLPILWVTCIEKLSGNDRHNFLQAGNFFNRLEVDRDNLSPEHREQFEEIQRKFEEEKKAREEEKKQFQEELARSKREEEFKAKYRMIQEQYPKSVHIDIKIDPEPLCCIL